MSNQNINLRSHLMDYVMPNPVFVMEHEKRSKYLHQVGDQLESVSKLFNHLADMGEKLCSTLADIFSELREVQVISSDSKYAPLTNSFRNTTLALRSNFLGINENVVQPLQEFVKIDLKNLKESRKQYERCSTVYDAAVEKHVSGFQKHFSIGSSSNILPPALHNNQQNDVKDSGLVQSHQQVTEAFFDFTSQMAYIEEKIKYVLPNLFISYLSLFEANFSACLKNVSDCNDQFKKIKEDADKSNDISQKQAQSDIKDKQELSEFLPKFWDYVISVENKNSAKANKTGQVSIGYTSMTTDSSTESNEEIADSTNPFDDFTYRTDISAKNSHSMQGFLWKKCKFNWKKRFFICNNGLLSYGKTVESTLKSPKEIDLLLCAAKLEPNSQRRNCFCVRTPNRKFELQALTAYEMNLWMDVILKNIIAKASSNNDDNNNNNSGKHKNQKGQNQIPNLPLSSSKSKGKSSNKQNDGSKIHHHNQSQNQNQHKQHQNDDEDRPVTVSPSKNICADCGARGASWVSITWGVTLCTSCAGVHRSLSSSISFVRSIELDDIPPAQIMIVNSIGPKRANSLLEGKLIMKKEKKKQHEEKKKKEEKTQKGDNDNNSGDTDDYETDDDSSSYNNENADENGSVITKIQPNASSQKRTLFIQQKYKQLAFVKMPKTKSVPNVFESIKKQSLIDVYNGLIYAKSKDAVPFIKGFTPLHASVCIGNPVILEFVLLQLPGYLNKLDDLGWSPLSYAAYYQSMPVVAFLLESGADPDSSPSSSHPYSIAKARGNNEIELLIRSFSKKAQKIENEKTENLNNEDDQNEFKLPETPPHDEFGKLESVHESTLLMEEGQQKRLKKLDTLTGNEIIRIFQGRGRDGKSLQPSTFNNDNDNDNS